VSRSGDISVKVDNGAFVLTPSGALRWVNLGARGAPRRG